VTDRILSCKEFVAFMAAYSAQELDAHVRAKFELHIGACPPCVDYLRGYEKTMELARGCCARDHVDSSSPPEALVAAILAATAGVADPE